MSSAPHTTTTARILIVEDEVLIADTLRMHLERNGYRVVDTAISYEQAVAAIDRHHPDAVLLDIQLSGSRTGIDVADYLRGLSKPPPFIFLTSQMDDHFLNLAKRTFPAAYLGKPIQTNSLLATLKMVTHNAMAFGEPERTVEFRHNGMRKVVRLSEINYLQSEHVYVRVVLSRGRTLLERASIAEVLAKFNDERFVQVHRSYAANLQRVTGRDATHLFYGRDKVPVSRSRRGLIGKLFGEG